MGYKIQPVHSLKGDEAGSKAGLPKVSKADNGKALIVKNGKWAPVKLSSPKLAKVATSGSYNDLKNVPDLSNFVSLTEVQNVVNEAVGDITSFDTQVVQELPAEGAKGTIYFLVNPDSAEANNNAKEYIFVDGNWELIGDTAIDLSPYVTWNNIGAAAESNDYNDLDNLPNIPVVPMGLSEFDNDAGFITADDLPENLSEFNNDAEYVSLREVEAFIKSRIKNDAGAAGMGYMAKSNGEYYDNVADVLADSESNVPVEVALTGDVDDGQALLLMEKDGDVEKDITIDLNGNEYIAVEAGGSAGTQTQAVHIEKDNTVVIKGGSLKGAIENPNIKMLIQNYANLTLEDMEIDCSDNPNIQYVVSNNFGNCLIKNCHITAPENGVAVDCWFGLNAIYDEGVTVTIEDSTINGKIEYGAQRASLSRPGNENWQEKAVLIINNSIINGEIVNSGAGANDKHCIIVDGVRLEGELPFVINAQAGPDDEPIIG